MKLHVPSFALGVAASAAVLAARKPLRPVAVEISALAVHCTRIAMSLVAREREKVEDFVAEVEARARSMVRGVRRAPAEAPIARQVQREVN